MKRAQLLLTFASLIFCFSTLNAQVRYIQKDAQGKGTSWIDASGDLNGILKNAKPGTQVWVAAGTYFPTTGTDREISFEVPNGVHVYGGFEGTETNLHQRDWISNETILSGEIGSESPEDNTLNVVFTKNVGASTVIDGFSITGGMANQAGPTGDNFRCGGGMYNDGSGQGNRSNPTIKNCLFINNYGRDGGGLYNNGRHGESSPTIINCQFIGNNSDLDGGAIFNDGRRQGKSNPTIKDCLVKGNVANYGGGIFNYGGAGECNPTLTSCHFVDNKAYIRGGGMFNVDVEGVCDPIMIHCKFDGNTGSDGKSSIHNYTPYNGEKPALTRNYGGRI